MLLSIRAAAALNVVLFDPADRAAGALELLDARVGGPGEVEQAAIERGAVGVAEAAGGGNGPAGRALEGQVRHARHRALGTDPGGVCAPEGVQGFADGAVGAGPAGGVGSVRTTAL
ncbi:hypothetical protein AB0D08_27895 [Kitasatospora sp. NPDC048540]|uniref:hypothetical protein n=1 Tax=Kitasatospora sp. NPDC048540 TaxID=3155634 RepID=UPI0033EADE0F